MARGGITIEDNAMIAANVQLISNNHDPYDLCTLTCKPVLIREYAWGRSWSYDTSGSMYRKTRNCGSWICSDKRMYRIMQVAVGNPAKVIKNA